MRLLPLRFIALGACLWLCWPLSSQALDFQQAYDYARRYDPSWLAAQSERDAGQQEHALGRSRLLPSLSYRYSHARNRSEVEQSTPLGTTTDDMRYTSYTSAITLTQPLLDAAAFAQYQAGKARANAAEATLERAYQALAVRVLQAYTDVLYAEDDIALAEAHLRSLQEESEKSAYFMAHGEGTRTDQLEIAAQSRLVEARLIEAEDRLQDAHNALSLLMGSRPASPLTPLSTVAWGSALASSQEVADISLAEWQALALAHNPELAAQRSALEAARHHVQAQNAGHLPTVQLYARSQLSDSSAENTIGQRYDTDSIGVEVSLPLYSGGRVVAASRQADSTYEQLRHELDAATADILNDVERQYRLVRSSQRREEAYRQSVEAAALRVEATQRSLQGGERTHLDVLDAERERFEALRDLARARYDYLVAWLSLRWQAGRLDDADIQQIAYYFSDAFHD